MNKKMHHTRAILVVLLFGLILFYVGTDGFRAFTAETARSNQLMKEQPPFPQVTLEDSRGRSYSFSEFENKYVFITFMYTSCTTVCWQLEANMKEVYDRLPQQYIGEDLSLIHI